MSILIGGGVILALVLGLIVAAYLKGQSSGTDSASVDAAEKQADVAKKMADAEAAGPHDQSAVVDRLRSGNF